LENNILSRFGFPIKIITENAAKFKPKKMEKICSDYNITLGHSTYYYPQVNGLVESCNKRLTRIINKLLQDNKKSWHKNIIHALWADMITTKRYIATSLFQIVYGTETIFPTTLGFPVMRLLQDQDDETNSTRKRIDELINVQQIREKAFNNSQMHQDKIKKDIYRHTKEDDFKLGYLC
jgi:transposase InsO family protein